MDFLRDLRLGFRLLLRAPGFAVTAILTLALGIGATVRARDRQQQARRAEPHP